MTRKPIQKSSGNVFADMGLPDSDHELLIAKLTLQIHRIISSRKLAQVAAATLLGTTQPQVSSLMRLRPTSLSVGRLMEFLIILGQDIEVTLKPAPKKRNGRVVVKAAA
jgi:predicted XRE-type DNA-binding protein